MPPRTFLEFGGRPLSYGDFGRMVAHAANGLLRLGVRAGDRVLDYQGMATIAGYSVVHDPGNQPRGVSIIDADPGRRAVVNTDDPTVIAQMQVKEFRGVTSPRFIDDIG